VSGSSHVAYLVNQYPSTSHSFVRREIHALEAIGVRVDRYAIRCAGAPLVEPADRAESSKTRLLLAGGFAALLWTTLASAVGRPLRFARALQTTARIARWSDRGRLRPWAWLLEACRFRRWLVQSGASHVHAHFGTNAAAVAMLTRVLGGPPYSFTAHGTESFDSPPSISLSEKIAHAAFVVAVSEWGRAQLMRWCPPAAWTRLHVVRCGVDGAFLGVESTPVPEPPRLVCVARLSPEKGVDVLVDAMVLLARAGRWAELVVMGDGPLRAQLSARLEAAAIGDRVRLLGWADGATVRREILAARALVVPSLGEGLPVVIMEALALGRPVVATAVGAIAELVETGVTGWLVPPGSPPALARALTEVLDARTERLTQMGERGAARIAERHDAAREASRLAELFGHRSPARTAPLVAVGAP
jgi:colanic acid/amylovoran biosynthesis glycosyltransferase